MPHTDHRRWLMFAAAGLAAVSLAACNTSTGASASTSTSGATAKASAGPAHSEDVAIASCGNDEGGFAAAKVVVTNHSSKPSNYAITIAFESDGGKTQIGTGMVAVDNLGPGQQSAPQDASSLQTAAGTYTCKVADITRYAS